MTRKLLYYSMLTTSDHRHFNAKVAMALNI